MLEAYNENELVIHSSSKKVFVLVIAALAFVVAGGFLFWVGLTDEEESAVLMVVGIISIVFFGLCLLYLVFQLFNKKPSLIVNDEGVTDNSSAISGGLIPWQDIEEIILYDYMGQRFIGLNLYDTEAYLARQKSMTRMLMKANRGLVRATVNITQASLPYPLEEVYEVMMNKWENVHLRQP
ncbi:hypothetical protein EDM21_16295 [Paenibacillus sp. N10]|uniref:Uncharacterized protein n=1 Tax=Paenibacillus lutrae TaxID=2078573 RepID=A0A7X3K0B1_9BACL|nr:hypothetical protein [Paenibacillus lutrae]